MYLEKFLWIICSMAVVWVGLTGYDYYKTFFWPQATAIVVAARETCPYSKGRSFSRQSRLPFCDDGEEAARLVANGFKLEKTKRLRIQAVFETEAGQVTRTTLEPYLRKGNRVGPSGDRVAPGSAIRIRYSPATPGSSELAIMPDGRAALFALGVAILAGYFSYVARRRRLDRAQTVKLTKFALRRVTPTRSRSFR